MRKRIAAAATLTGAVVTVTGASAASALNGSGGSTPSTSSTSVADPATTATTATSSTTAPTAASTTTTVANSPAAHPARAEAGANPDAYYGNPKVGVDIATGTPGLYPVFGDADQPNLTGFSVNAMPGTDEATLTGEPDPQPVCDPDTTYSADPAPNLYCQADTDEGYEFPMGSPDGTFDFGLATSQPGYVEVPGQTVSQFEFSCGQQGTDDCDGGINSDSETPVFFDLIGIYRQLQVTVTNSSSTGLSGVTVSLSCTAPAGDPSYACPPTGEANNLSTQKIAANVLGSPSTSTTSVVTGGNGTAAFSGVYLPGVTVTLTVTPPAGYQGASVVSSVPSPVTSSTTTAASISSAAQTPVDLPIVLAAAAPPTTIATTTTSTSSTTSTTVAASTTTTTATAASSGTLPLTGANALDLAGDAGLLLATGSGLVVIGRRRRPRGAHFKSRR